MCIITKLDVAVSPRYRHNKKTNGQQGFTLPEVLVSLCIVMFLLQGVFQWGIIMQCTADTMAQNQQAVFLARQLYAGIPTDLSPGWSITVDTKPTGGLLYASHILIAYNSRQWQFYYVGSEALYDGM